MSLNPAQREAVHYLDGPLLVLAGAGSGKTRVITEKIAHLIRARACLPERITAITFTNKAAREMRERTQRLLKRGDDESQPVICTFHALGLKLLQIECGKVGLRRGFSVFDSDDTLALIKELCPAGIKNDALEAQRQLVSRAKNEGLDPEQALERAQSAREQAAADLYAQYQRRLQAFNAVDFDDLIRLPLRLLEGDDEVRASWQERIRYLLVDEYQDTNRAQYRLVRLLSGTRGAFTAVGDDDQSIYAWRGAEPENLKELARDYPKLKLIKLEQNYRSSARILRAANALIGHNAHLFDKRLWSEHADGDAIQVQACRDDKVEAERVAADVSWRATESKSPWSEFAVLYRGNHQARVLEQALRLARVPYHLTGGTSFFDRAEVKDLLAYLRLIANPDDDAAFLRAVVAPKREIGATTLEKLGQSAGAQQQSLVRAAESPHVLKLLAARPAAALSDFVDLLRGLRGVVAASGVAGLAERLIEATGYARHLQATSPEKALMERRLANANEFMAWLKDQAKGRADAVGELAAQLALMTNADRDEPGNAVRLMTLHSAKGLEFGEVYLVGLEDGTLPHEAGVEEGRLEEERRLFYVGITRARRRLSLSYAETKTRFGETLRQQPSRFLAELPAAELHWRGQDPERDQSERQERARVHLDRIAALIGGG